MKKKFIRDKKGKVTYCNANISKFSIIEYVKYGSRSWFDFFFPVELDKSDLLALLRVLAFISQIIPLWFIASIYSIKKTIKRAKKASAKC